MGYNKAFPPPSPKSNQIHKEHLGKQHPGPFPNPRESIASQSYYAWYPYEDDPQNFIPNLTQHGWEMQDSIL